MPNHDVTIPGEFPEDEAIGGEGMGEREAGIAVQLRRFNMNDIYLMLTGAKDIPANRT